jgi:hypothetical protein
MVRGMITSIHQGGSGKRRRQNRPYHPCNDGVSDLSLARESAERGFTGGRQIKGNLKGRYAFYNCHSDLDR